jgi:hypothetical protein
MLTRTIKQNKTNKIAVLLLIYFAVQRYIVAPRTITDSTIIAGPASAPPKLPTALIENIHPLLDLTTT